MKAINGGYIKSHMIDGNLVTTIWLNGKVIWQAVNSAFGSGAWINEKPWINSDAWKNN